MENVRLEEKYFVYLALIGILFLAIFFPAIRGLINRWNEDPNFSHGFLIPFVALYLIWEKRSELEFNPSEISYLSLTGFIFGLILYLLGIIGQAQIFMNIAFYISLVSMVFYLGGMTLGKKLAFPLIYLLFMIPVPYSIYDRITIPLKLFATRFSAFFITLIGVPIIREGAVLHLPNTSLEVADACSGLRSLISIMALGAVFAYYNQKTIAKRIILFLSSIPIAIIGNIIRITLTAWIAYAYGQKIALSFLHEFSGILIFIFGLIFLFFSGELLNWGRKSS